MNSVYIFIITEESDHFSFSEQLKKLLNIGDSNPSGFAQERENSYLGEYFSFEFFAMTLNIYANEDEAYMGHHEDYPICIYADSDIDVDRQVFHNVILFLSKIIKENFVNSEIALLY